MKPVVIIHIDSLRREYVSSWFLGQQFKRAGYRVILTSRTSTSYLLRRLTPELVILSHVFSLTPDVLTALFRRKVKVYINEVEGVLKDEAGIASTYPAGYIDYALLGGVFVWSQWSRDWLIQNRNLDPTRVHATGSIRNSIVIKRSVTRATPVVGILSRFELINTFDGRHNFENLLALDPEDEGLRWYYDRCAIDSEAFSIVAKMIGVLTAKGVAVLIRPHPNENLSSYQLLKEKFGPLFDIDDSRDLTEWLGKVSVIVGPTSTAYTEAYLANIPIVSTQGIQKCHYTGADRVKVINEFSRAAYMPQTVDDAVTLCVNTSLSPIDSPELNEYFDSFYSIKKQADPVDEIVEFVDRDVAASLLTKRLTFRWLGPILKYLIDVAILGRVVLTRHPLKSLREMNQYNFNSALHRPSAYMKKIEKEKARLSH
jgi:surface carbohydrate biosynthesis protein